jgi:hypothetical protein
MLPLREVQARFAEALLGDDAAGIAGEVVADGLAPAARVAVYRHHVRTSLGAALRATYPVVCRLVDARFFAFAADEYVRAHPPSGPCLFEYGGSFPDFLASFPPCAPYPYLADVARLEWAMAVAFHAIDAPPLGSAALAGVSPDDVPRLVLATEPSASWLRSPWPVDRIWEANQDGADPATTVALDAGPAALEIRRREAAVGCRRLAEPALAFRQAIGRGATLERAADAALGLDPAFDLTAAIRALFDEALLTGFTLASE